MFMKSKTKLAVLHTPPVSGKKTSYQQAATAIQKKLAEIKQQNSLPAPNTNLSLFR